MGLLVGTLVLVVLAAYGFTIGAFWGTMPATKRTLIDFEARICELEDMRRDNENK